MRSCSWTRSYAEGDWGEIDALVERHGGPVALVVTCPWHVRSAGEAIRRYVNSPGIEAWAHTQAVKDRERIGFEVAHVVRGQRACRARASR